MTSVFDAVQIRSDAAVLAATNAWSRAEDAQARLAVVRRRGGSRWAHVDSVDLAVGWDYLIQRVEDGKPISNPCLALWDDRGWTEIIGRIPRLAPGSSIEVWVD